MTQKFKFFILIVCALLSEPVWAGQKHGLMPGLAITPRYGLKPRVSVDVGAVVGKHADAVSVYGLLTGLNVNDPQEFYLGGVIGGFYIGSMCAEAAINFYDFRPVGARVTGAFGLAFFLGFVSLGYDTRSDRPLVELGVMAKLPILFD